MTVERNEAEIHLGDLTAYLAQLLLQLPDRAEPYDAHSRARLFGGLTAGGDKALDAVWRKHAEPKLRACFKGHQDVVTTDLRSLTGPKNARKLVIPIPHLPAWVHTLNQARIVTAARLRLTEEELRTDPANARGPNATSLLAINVFGYLLNIFLQQIETGEPRQPAPGPRQELPGTSPEARVVVQNDPINLMEYVPRVFMDLFNFSRDTADQHMREVHEAGRSVVWSGDRRTADYYVEQLHFYLLKATLELTQ
jgi:ATP-dependent Clp protease adaptor protein ClpS